MNTVYSTKLILVKLDFFIFFFEESQSLYMAVQYTNMEILYSQSASSLKVIQKSTFVLSRSAPIRHNERPVWASSLPDSFSKVMAVVKREISYLNLFRIQHGRLRMQKVSNIFISFYFILFYSFIFYFILFYFYSFIILNMSKLIFC